MRKILQWQEDGQLCGLENGAIDPIGGGTVNLTYHGPDCPNGSYRLIHNPKLGSHLQLAAVLDITTIFTKISGMTVAQEIIGPNPTQVRVGLGYV